MIRYATSSQIVLLTAALAAVSTTGLFAKPAPHPQHMTQGKPVSYQTYGSYFESNQSGLKGPASYLAFTSQAAFDKVFGAAAIMGHNHFLPSNAFQSKMVVAVVKRGHALWNYSVQQVTADKGTLFVHYRAAGKVSPGATYASPLIVAVDKKPYASVVFIENGHQAGTATVKK